MKTACRFSLQVLLSSVTATGFKLGSTIVSNQSTDAFPDCQGSIIEKVYGNGEWQCSSLSGPRSAAAEAKCSQSYDIDAAGDFWQCGVDAITDEQFNCKHQSLCKVGFNPASVWEQLPDIAADALPKRTGSVVIPGTEMKVMEIGRLTDSKFAACGTQHRWGSWFCNVVEDVVGGMMQGDLVEVESAGVQHEHIFPWADNKVIFCWNRGHSGAWCRFITSKDRTLTVAKKEDDLAAPAWLTKPWMAMIEKYEEGKGVICYQNRLEWAKNHAIVCGLVAETEGKLHVGPLKTIHGGMTMAYVYAALTLVGPGKVMACYRKDADWPERRDYYCRFLTVDGDTLSVGEVMTIKQRYDGHGHAVMISKTEALLCSSRNTQCWLLDVTGSVPVVTFEMDMPNVGSHRLASMAVLRLWSDRAMYCWGIRRVNAGYGNPYCVVVTCKDKKCSVGEKFHPNDSDSENSPRGQDIDAVMLAPGKVGTCTQDLNNDGYAVKDNYHKVNPVCSVFTLPHGA